MNLKTTLKKFIISLLPAGVIYEIRKPLLLGIQKGEVSYDSAALMSYSQEGEDLILQRIFGDKKNGFFVDVGAHHPVRFSNTWLLYKQGWRGINIDAMPGSMQPFTLQRPEDINLEVPVSDKPEDIEFFIFNEPALNTFSKEEANKKNGYRDYKIVQTKVLHTRTLNDILSEHVKEGQSIDLLTVDVEGLDYQVLLSNDWDKFRPQVILVEELIRDLDLILKQSRVRELLESKGYSLFAKTYNTLFFTRKG